MGTQELSKSIKFPRVKKASTIFFLKALLFFIGVLAIVLVRRMDQMSYRSITEEEALEMAQEIKITLPDQEVTMLNTGEPQKLKTGKTVKVLGVYKNKLNKGNSPRVYWTNQNYLMELPDGTRAYGPLMETAVGHLNIFPEGDTAVITAVKLLKKNPVVQKTGEESRFQYAYTIEGHEGQYALEDLRIYFPQRVVYLANGLTPGRYTAGNDTLAENKKDFQKVKKFFLYDIRPITKKTGFFVFPKYQVWNEFYLQRWFRNLMIFFAYLLEIGLIVLLFIRRHEIKDNWIANHQLNRNLRRAKRGDADACFEVGEACFWGFSGWHGVRKSTKAVESFWWYRQAADWGNAESCEKVGEIYENGDWNEEIDYYKAKEYYQKGADSGNKKCKEGVERLTRLLSRDSEFGKAYFLAKLGTDFYTEDGFYGWAYYDLGRYYIKGEYVQFNDKEAFKWFKKLADKNDCNGYFGLALCYMADHEHSKRMPDDIPQAISLLNKAIDMGINHPEDAYYNIGVCYDEIKDHKQAMNYFKKALGYNAGEHESKSQINAMYNIGVLYYNGQGVQRDRSEAYWWWKKAAVLGHEDAIKALKKEGVDY